MTAPLYLVDTSLAGVLAGADLVLDGDEGRHAATVRRTQPGERVDLADGAGGVARCVVRAVRPGVLDLVAEVVERVPDPAVRMVLVQALAKGGRDELAVETATELGVDEVAPWQAERSVVIWSGERGRRARAKWVATVRAAAKQSRRVRLPDVAEAVTTAVLSRRVAECVAGGGLALVLDGDAPVALARLVLPVPMSQVLVIVGPEGGIAPSELAMLTAAGAVTVRLGPHVLRTSSAGAAALAVLSVRAGRWT